MARYNSGDNESYLRMSIGDDGIGAFYIDAFQIGTTTPPGVYSPVFSFFSNGSATLGNAQTSGRRKAISIQNGNYTLSDRDEIVVFTASATVTLPAATGTGQTYRICNETTSLIVIIDGNGADTVKGAASQSLYGNEDVILTDYKIGGWI